MKTYPAKKEIKIVGVVMLVVGVIIAVIASISYKTTGYTTFNLLKWLGVFIAVYGGIFHLIKWKRFT